MPRRNGWPMAAAVRSCARMGYSCPRCAACHRGGMATMGLTTKPSREQGTMAAPHSRAVAAKGAPRLRVAVRTTTCTRLATMAPFADTRPKARLTTRICQMMCPSATMAFTTRRPETTCCKTPTAPSTARGADTRHLLWTARCLRCPGAAAAVRIRCPGCLAPVQRTGRSPAAGNPPSPNPANRCRTGANTPTRTAASTTSAAMSSSKVRQRTSSRRGTKRSRSSLPCSIDTRSRSKTRQTPRRTPKIS
mmetsp:Transcript_70900/g.196995  ORF Transcript_70900/g.196995 Transcript_70900/m.196995 type:complete len:249 (-) Transcript_70900:814-1560(-)